MAKAVIDIFYQNDFISGISATTSAMHFLNFALRKTEINKVIAITGARSGICKATAELLVAQSAKVVLGARRIDRLKTTVETIEQNGGEAAFLENRCHPPRRSG